MDIFSADDAATPLTEEECQGLLQSWVTTRADLNAIEAENITEAQLWTFTRKRKDVLNEKFLKTLHHRMFGKVWRWAGKPRQTERNIGVAPHQIASQLRVLLEDTQYWITHKTWEPDEIAARFHHRLVWIHPFPNGNGRHARLMTDLLLVYLLECTRFSWGQSTLITPGEDRARYIQALREADNKNYQPLLNFVRS